MEEGEAENGEKKVDESSTKKKPNDEKSKYDNINAEQELLGSVTTINNPGLRTSARVIQKMKQDSIRPSTPPPPEKKDVAHEKGVPRTPSQARPPKVIWSNFERNLLFDGINEFGKDFESIANFINSKIKRKSAADQSCCKTKEQVRQMYYQSFHKISKYLKFSDDVKKPAQELYALINYGEMRRKLQFVSEKNCMKIKDLVYKGHVTVRNKGKNIRIKTPPCKALRKLNQLDDWQQDINLPAKIEVCLKPANMEAWARVQCIAQNPLVQTSVPLQKKLVNVIKTFQNKWRNEETKLALKAFAMGKQNQNSKQQPETKPVELDQSTGYQEPLLCLCPPSNAVIHKPLISVSEFLSSFSICLNSYEQKIGVKVRGETLCNKRQRSDSGCEKKSPESKKVKTEAEIKSSTDCPPSVIEGDDVKEPKIYLSEVSNSNHSNPDEFASVSMTENHLRRLERHDSNEFESVKKVEVELISTNDNAVSGFMSPDSKSEETTAVVEVASKVAAVDVKPRKKDVKCSGNKKKEHKNMSNLRPLLDEETERKLRNGWTISNASDISVGDLYITFGHDSKISFEYYWVKKEVEKNPKKERSSMPYNVNNVDEDSSKSIKSSNIGNKLRHLLLIASLTERVKRKPCSCGHICEKGAKHKKGDGETAAKTYVSNKTYSQSNSDCLFRQPVAPFRRPGLQMENIRLIQNGFRYNHARLLMKSRSLASKQVVVQRLLPVQPGMNQSYDVVTPQVHVRTIVEKPSLPPPPPRPGIEKTPPIRPDKVKEEAESHVEESVASISISPAVDTIVESATTTRTNPIERPFKALGKKLDITLDSPSNSTVSIEECSSPLSTISLLSLGSSEDLFASGSSDDSGIASSNGISKIININDDPGIQQLMEISLPSSAPTQSLDENDMCSIPPMSPMRLIRESSSDPKWLEENLSDFSLSSFLGHLDEMNRDMDTMSVISESSQDYMTKFAEIAASMQNEDKDL